MSEFDKYRETLPLHQMIVSANCCRHAFEYRQAKIDELQESNLNLEGECVQLQNRIDTALALIDTSSYAEIQRRLPDFMDQLKEALRGDHST